MIELNGKDAEGGGQILRSALALALATGQAFRLVEVRGNRAKPGLMRQHLTALRAAAAVCNGRVTGDDLGSRTVSVNFNESGFGYAYLKRSVGACQSDSKFQPARMSARRREPSVVVVVMPCRQGDGVQHRHRAQ